MIRKTKIFILCMLLAGLLILFLVPVISANNIRINYGQEAIGIITLTETISDSGIALEKTGETMPSSNQPSQSSSGGGSGGGGITIIKEKEIIKIVPQEESEDKESKGDWGEVETSGGVGITGGVIGSKILTKDNLVLLVVLLNTFILVYFLISSRIKKK